jgi:HAD-superfamily hydrolase, subfamily IIB
MRADEVIIYSDMDGTMLTDWSLGPYVPEANLTAIKGFLSAGGMFSIASGRQFTETLPFFGDIKFSAPMVQGNGSVIYDCLNGRILKKVSLPEDVKEECLKYRDRNKGVWLIAADEFDIYQVESEDKAWDSQLNDKERRIITVSEYFALELVKVCYVIADENELPGVLRDLQSFDCAEKCRFTQSSPVFLEVLEKSTGKAPAIAEAVKLAHAENRHLVCIGDYDNDCDMLSLAEIAACPENSSPRILEMAQIVTCSNNEGAIADLIRKLELS